MVKKKSAPKVKETLDITDELIAERRTSLKMPKDMVPWMAKTIEFIDAKMLLTGKIICWICVPLIFSMVYEVIGRHFFNRPTLWVYDVTRMSAGAFLCFEQLTLYLKEYILELIFYTEIGKLETKQK